MEKSIITDSLIQLTKSLVNIVFLCITYCVTNAEAVMYGRNVPMAEHKSEFACFQSKKSEYM